MASRKSSNSSTITRKRPPVRKPRVSEELSVSGSVTISGIPDSDITSPVTAVPFKAPLVISDQEAVNQVNEALLNLRAAGIVLDNVTRTEGSKALKRLHTAMKPGLDRIALAAKTAWEANPEPLRLAVEGVAPHVGSAVAHLAIALTIATRVQASRAVVALTPLARRLEGEALMWLSSAAEALVIDVQAETVKRVPLLASVSLRSSPVAPPSASPS